MNQGKVKAELRVVELDMLTGPTLLFGAAHCGKSEMGHKTMDQAKPAAIIGTASPSDNFLEARIQNLKAQRPTIWETFESIVEMPPLMKELCAQYPQVLVDSVNQYIGYILVKKSRNYSHDQLRQMMELEIQDMLKTAINAPNTNVLFISSEVGAGVPPQSALSRLFRHLCCYANYTLAQGCRNVVMVQAGIPIQIKG